MEQSKTEITIPVPAEWMHVVHSVFSGTKTYTLWAGVARKMRELQVVIRAPERYGLPPVMVFESDDAAVEFKLKHWDAISNEAGRL